MKLVRISALSLRALGRARTRTLLSASSMTIGIAATFLLLSLSAGSEQAFEDALAAMGKNLLAVSSVRRQSDALRGESTRLQTLTLGDWQAVSAELDSVLRAAPIAMSSFTLRYRGRESAATVIGTSPEFRISNVYDVSAGRFFDDQDMADFSRVVVIGSLVADELFFGEEPIGETVVINGAPYTVIGLLVTKGADVGGVPQDDKVLVPVTTAMRRLLNVDYIDRMFVQAASKQLVPQAMADVRELLRSRHGLYGGAQDDFTLRDQSELVQTVSRSEQTMKKFLTGLSSLLLVLASVGLFAVGLLAVRERRSEIGLRLAVGALPRHVMLQFLGEAVLIALLGALAGLLLGGIGTMLGQFIMNWQMQITGLNALYTMLIPLGLALIGGAYPALQAARLDPILALRG